MPLIAEDGTGLPAANSYASLAFADDYHNLRQNSSWAAATTQARESALVRATDYIETRFRARFMGVKEYRTQSLSWPRNYVYDLDGYEIDGVPKEIQHATCEYALRALTTPVLAPDQSPDAGRVQSKTVRVGPLQESFSYAVTPSGSSATSGLLLPKYPAADLLISPFLSSAVDLVLG